MKNTKVKILIVVVAVLIVVSGLIVLGEACLNDRGLTPAIGSRISSIEIYGRTPAERNGPVPTAGSKKDVKFKYIASSGVLHIETFDKQSYMKNNPKDFCVVERDSREGIEVVHIYTDNSKIGIAEYIH